MDRTVTATALGQAATHDLSLWGLFLQADWVVKLVMIGLLLASVWVWAPVKARPPASPAPGRASGSTSSRRAARARRRCCRPGA